ncbi:hypothetical protein DACRYDRAFT_113225 [Dacryopinax primogenitus]|uniref:TRP C-terminal domain-containing protein n=1 Tax=Dacryopinax primogenitus (strain DJM 731) TaxID=1858805 RepID=M5GFS3_DACPD|nr:uncharacterized protein DACRYDRAFT_113225 [Dacryopinax primogenitus]EJU06547.1 hypothetical protein DACRYDRAFT_113225 [Dacryopinax primogenitus]
MPFHVLRRLLLLAICVRFAAGQALEFPFSSCSVQSASYYNASRRIHVNAVYGQMVTQTPDGTPGRWLNFTLLGSTNNTIFGASNASTGEVSKLATMFTNSSSLTFDVYDNASFFCLNLRPASPLPYPLSPIVNESSWLSSNATYCPLSPGPLAFSAAVPLDKSYEFNTITTQIRVVDTSDPPFELACIDIATSPMPDHDGATNRFGILQVILWVSVALTIGYWAVNGLARISAAWSRGGERRGGIAWSDIRWAGTVLASAISGERFAACPALLRFCTPLARDVVFHTQWAFALGLVAVQWPQFTYPMFAQLAWASLVYNVTITQGTGPDKHWDPLTAPPLVLPDQFNDQIVDTSSPLYLDLDAPNYLLTFPPDTDAGIPSMAAMIGVRPQDLFGICLSIFLIIVAGVIFVSLLIWFLSWVGTVMSGPKRANGIIGGSRSPTYSTALDSVAKEFGELDGTRSDDNMPGSQHGHSNLGHSVGRSGGGRKWWHYRLGQGSFHGNVLHGNLVRVLLLFHFPITVFSVYQLSLDRSIASISSVVLAALAFAILSIIIPALLLLRVAAIPTPKLYDATRTLLAFGPFYNTYMQKSQMFACVPLLSNLVIGIVIGAGWKSGIAQAVIILAVEVSTALATSIFLPWGKGAHMGILSFAFVVGRIATAVLLVILSPTVSVGTAAGGWIAVAVLIIQGLIYVQFLLMLLIKIIEGLVRLVTGVSFDKSSNDFDSGLVGAIGVGCFPTKHTHNKHKSHTRNLSNSGSSQNMLRTSPGPSPIYAQVPNTTSTTRSFLSPAHLGRPYRETLDDDQANFSIMRAWQPFPQYTAVATSPVAQTASHERLDSTASPPRQAPPSAPQSGFTRVRGGRANFESPYTLLTGAAPVPSLPPGAAAPVTPASSPANGRVMHPPSPGRSALAAARAATGSSPRISPTAPPSSWPGNQVYADESPGSSQRLHARTKSQTAIIEDASELREFPPLTQTQSGPSRTGGASMARITSSGIALAASTSRSSLGGLSREAPLPPPTSAIVAQNEAVAKAKKGKRWFRGLSNPMDNSDDEGDEASPQGRSTHWFRRNRRRSEGDMLSAPRMAALEKTKSEQGAEIPSTSGRSFVVMRPLKHGQGGGSSGGASTAASASPAAGVTEFVPAHRPVSSADTPGSSSNNVPPSIPRKSSRRRPSSSGN